MPMGLAGPGGHETLGLQMMLRSVEHRGMSLPGVPFDDRSHIVPNSDDCVLGPDGQPMRAVTGLR